MGGVILSGPTQGGGSGGAPSGPAGGDLSGTYPDPQIAANAVGSPEIAADAVGTSEIANAAVTAAKLAAGLVPLTELFDSTLGADAASIDSGAGGFSTDLDHLLIIILARTTEAVLFSQGNLRFNADAGANYDWQEMRGRNAAAAATQAGAATEVRMTLPGSSVAASIFAAHLFLMPSYAQTTAHKVVINLGGYREISTSGEISARISRWANTAAVSRVQLLSNSGNLLAGSRMTIYGIG